MKKKEITYRTLLEEGVESQLGLSKKLGFSLSTVNNALKPLQALGAVEVKQRGLVVREKEKILLYWASARNLAKDVVYSTRSPLGVVEIEKSMPPGVLFSCYSGFKLLFKQVPADYGEVFVYASESVLEEVKRRFPSKQGPPNVIVLKQDEFLVKQSHKSVVPESQLFVDLWNAREWYAREFLKKMEEKLHEKWGD